MTLQQKNSALVLAIVCGLISLPLNWMTLHGAKVTSGLGESFDSHFGEMTVSLTGLNGKLTTPMKMPIWCMVALASAGSVMQFMSRSQLFAIPRLLEWVVSLTAAIFIALVFLLVFSGKISLGLGSLLGLISAVIPILCLALPTSEGSMIVKR